MIGTNDYSFTAGLNGLINAELYDSNDVAINLTGCTATFKLYYIRDDNELLSLPMTVYSNGKCTVALTPTNTDMLSRGEYEMKIIIVDNIGNTNGTERIKISIKR